MYSTGKLLLIRDQDLRASLVDIRAGIIRTEVHFARFHAETLRSHERVLDLLNALIHDDPRPRRTEAAP